MYIPCLQNAIFADNDALFLFQDDNLQLLPIMRNFLLPFMIPLMLRSFFQSNVRMSSLSAMALTLLKPGILALSVVGHVSTSF